MTAIDHDLLAIRVTAMADDPAMVVPFVEDFGDRLRGLVRRVLSDYGRHDLLRDPDDVDGIMWDIALVLQARAGSWDPAQGVAPWTWARAAVVAEIDRSIGHRAADIDADDLERVLGAGPSSPPARTELDLDALAAGNPLVALWLETTRAVASELHATVHVEYRVQTMLGDPSPSQTIAVQLGLSAANVRQIDRRVRVKLNKLIAIDPRFGDLGRLEFLGQTQQPRAGPSPIDGEAA